MHIIIDGQYWQRYGSSRTNVHNNPLRKALEDTFKLYKISINNTWLRLERDGRYNHLNFDNYLVWMYNHWRNGEHIVYRPMLLIFNFNQRIIKTRLIEDG